MKLPLSRSKGLRVLLFAFAIAVILIARPAFHLSRAVWNDRDQLLPSPPGTIDDASRLNQTAVAEIWTIPSDIKQPEEQLRALLQRAQQSHLNVSIAGARHSMGGHTISSNGIVIDMLPFHEMRLDETNNILWVQAGARWSEVIRFLNERGRSPEIMQSNDDFSVGGSISVNCHGWQFGRPPIASSVKSFRLMKADGTIVRCSRIENAGLFSLVLGGYGLFGIILDVELQVVRNEIYKAEQLFVATAHYARALESAVKDGRDIAMIYGRLRVTKEHFLEDAIINLLHRVPATNAVVTQFVSPKNATLKRAVFRGSAESDYGKEFRWNAERNWGSYLSGDTFERNALLYEPVSLFQGRRADHTDILMECFVPAEEFEPFLADLRKIIPASGADLMNITVRHVNRDEDTFLHFATEDMFALVMLFNQKRDVKGEQTMAGAAREIIDASLSHRGRYYLPYRLHATGDQFVKAYPQAERFFTLKRQYDPAELFQNEFYKTYGRNLK